MFVKGQSGNPAGKPKGSKDKSHLRAITWLEKVEIEWPGLKPYERATIASRIGCALLPREISHLNPEESVQNVESTLKLLKMLQEVARNGGNNTGTVSRGDSVGVVNGGLETQAPDSTI